MRDQGRGALIMFTKMFGPPPLANEVQLRRQDDYDDHAVSIAREG